MESGLLRFNINNKITKLKDLKIGSIYRDSNGYFGYVVQILNLNHAQKIVVTYLLKDRITVVTYHEEDNPFLDEIL